MVKTVSWNIKKMPIDSKNRIKALAAETGLSIPQLLVQLERQTKRSEFVHALKRGEE